MFGTTLRKATDLAQLRRLLGQAVVKAPEQMDGVAEEGRLVVDRDRASAHHPDIWIAEVTQERVDRPGLDDDVRAHHQQDRSARGVDEEVLDDVTAGLPHADRATYARAVILAGGRGTRLAPYTSVLPKPLMPVGEQAILELVVEQLEACGITDITFCVGYLAHLIQAVFDQRSNGHVQIRYVHEENALGTAGPLRLVGSLDDSFIAMNGDVLTTLNFRELLHHHRKSGNVLTIATHERSIKIDYGVLHVDGAGGSRVQGYEEKPELVSSVSMGIYVMEPVVVEYVPADTPFDFPDLVQALLRDSQPVGAYRHEGIWFDIGRRDDYEQAVASWTANGNGHPHARADGVMPEAQ
jgi:NDP-mannose synthase